MKPLTHFLLLSIALVAFCHGCVYWIPSHDNRRIPADAFKISVDGVHTSEDFYACICHDGRNNPHNKTGSILKYKDVYLCAYQGDGPEYCSHNYSVMAKRYMREPFLRNSTKEEPIPHDEKKLVPGFEKGQYFCAAYVSGYEGIAGTLSYDRGRKEWRCSWAFVQSLGGVSGHKYPGQYAFMEGTKCLL